MLGYDDDAPSDPGHVTITMVGQQNGRGDMPRSASWQDDNYAPNNAVYRYNAAYDPNGDADHM